jgi:4-alpha-glucanotransferase
MKERYAGVLLPITALPSPYGVGTFGAKAKEFVDFLVKSGQSVWQILPLCPTSFGDSPYQSPSSFALNPYFISPEILIESGLLKTEECERYSADTVDGQIDYGELYKKRYSRKP